MKYSIIINDFSHASTRMISPYLLTSMIDIVKMEEELNKVIITEQISFL